MINVARILAEFAQGNNKILVSICWAKSHFPTTEPHLNEDQSSLRCGLNVRYFQSQTFI